MSYVIYWTDVCGNRSEDDALWSEALTLNTTEPDLTRCFQDTILVWFPSVVLWLCGLVYLVWLSQQQRLHRICEASRLNAAKLVLGSLLCGVALVDVFYTYLTQDETGHERPLADYIKPLLLLASFIFSTFLTSYEYQKGVHTGGVLFFFWFLSFITGIIPFRSLILHIDYDDQEVVQIDQLLLFCTFYVRFFLVLLLFCLSLFADTAALSRGNITPNERLPLLLGHDDNIKEDQPNSNSKQMPCPEESCSFLSRLSFAWITPLIIQGYRRALTYVDLPNILAEDKSSTILSSFEKEWQKEVINTKFKLLAADKEIDEAIDPGRKRKVPSVWRAIIRTFGGYYMCAGIFKLIYDLFSFINPLILNELISFIASKSPFVWQGYVYGVAMFVIAMVRTISLQQYYDMCYRTGMRLRTAVTGKVYRKALKLSNAAKRTCTVGEIVNLMSVDAQKLQDAPGYMHMLWSTPLTITLATYFLYQQLGVAVFAGVAIMFLLIPVNGLIAAKTRTLQISQMKFKDSRIRLVNEVLGGIKVLKLYAWESSFSDRIFDIRNSELKVLKTSLYLSAISSISWFMTPYLVALGSFAVYVLMSPDNVLDANKAFVSLSLFNILNFPMSVLPAVLTFGVQAAVSIGRITRFLTNEEIDPDLVIVNPAADSAVSISDGRFAWTRGDQPVLKNINLDVKENHLIAVVGQVGSGKSSLISAILGEMETIEGQVTVKSTMAYVPQQAWIQNKTLKDNIIFGKADLRKQYKKIIGACALEQDLKILPGGDMTEIGEKGINLSGGQKQRVSLARAVYQDADIYLLDDPLSAVDAHVGKHIFEQVIGPQGLLKYKTRILVTNSLTYLKEMDNIVVLSNGGISEIGTFDELLSHKGAFADFVATYLVEMDSDEDEEQENVRDEVRRQLSSLTGTELPDKSSDQASDKESQTSDRSSHRSRRRTGRMKSKSSVMSKDKAAPSALRPTQRLTEEEAAMTGTVKFSVFWSYFQACGYVSIGFLMVFYLLTIIAQVVTSIWLSEWSNDKPNENGTQDIALRDLRLGVYGGLGIFQSIGVLGQGFMLAVGCVLGSRVLHSSLLSNILRAPMSFYDTTPLGRIVNRLSRDIDILDVNLPLTIRIWLGTFSAVVTTIVVICYSTPIFLSVAVPLGFFYFFVQRFYISMSRQVKRLDSVRRSPIYTHFSETVSGASSIRAYRKQRSFADQADSLVDQSQVAYFPSIISNRWIGLWLEFIGNLIVLFSAVFAVLERDSISAGLAGLSVSYALQVTGAMNMVVRMTCDMETYIVAVERIKEYADCPKEAAEIVEGNRPQPTWPQTGVVEFQHYSTRYRPGLELVLRDINCHIQPLERVGIVGRTGAGKSSLTLGLFRLIEAATGHIVIDDIKINNIGLHDLRSKLTIIPQDPVIFSGTLRMNLDPFERHTDEEVWGALEQAHLKAYILDLPALLQHHCAEGGENLSIGQRQLVCLARALLRKTKILILDEATAAIDLETDDLIQTTIRTEFRDCTVITIAHRLNTIMDYDRVMVLDNGRIVEFDSPAALQRNPDGIFYGMARDAGLIGNTNGNKS